jgi:hypothetical protein
MRNHNGFYGCAEPVNETTVSTPAVPLTQAYFGGSLGFGRCASQTLAPGNCNETTALFYGEQ